MNQSPSPAPENLYASLPITAPGFESFLTLLDGAKVKVEQIVSNAHASPKDFWYDQEDDEWVLLLRGGATLEFSDRCLVELSAGSHLFIPKHTRHRVERTEADTIWLAIFLKP